MNAYANDDHVSIELLKHQNEKPQTNQTTSIPPLFPSKRLLVTIAMFFSLVCVALVRNNVNIAVVEMTSNKNVSADNVTFVKPAEFDWDTTTIGVVLSMLSYGGLLSFFGGFLVTRLGGSTSFAACLALCGALTVLHPFTLSLHFYIFVACRFLTGFIGIFTAASATEIFTRWFPETERSRLIAYSFNGMHAGVALTYPLCGYIAHSFGWQMVFYVTGTSEGIMTIIMSIIFCVLIKNHPSQDKFISKRELSYILQETTRDTGKKVINPYKKILLSGPVWALCFSDFTYMWVYTVIAACLPLYAKDMTQKNTKEIGFISLLPNLLYVFMFPIVGTLMDFWKNRANVTETKIHKIVVSVVLISGSVLLLCAAFFSNFYVTLVMFGLIQILMSFISLVVEIINVSVAPNHGSVVSGLSSALKELGNVASRTITGYMIMNHSLAEWNHCFILAAGIMLLNTIFFVVNGSSEAQSWSLAATYKKSSITLDKNRAKNCDLQFSK